MKVKHHGDELLAVTESKNTVAQKDMPHTSVSSPNSGASLGTSFFFLVHVFWKELHKIDLCNSFSDWPENNVFHLHSGQFEL